MTVDVNYFILLIVWILFSLRTGLVSWSRPINGVGFIQIYLVVLFAEHWIPALIYALPWYKPFNDPIASQLGFEQSLIGVIGLLVGALWAAPALIPKFKGGKSRESRENVTTIGLIEASPTIPALYTILGFLTYFVFLQLGRNIATVSSFVSILVHLTQVGLMALYYYAYTRQNRLLGSIVLTAALLFPLLTVIQNGQAWFGVWSTIMIIMFTARVGRISRFYPVFLFILLYFGMSFFVSYFLVRSEIRRVTWYTQDATFSDRFGTLNTLFNSFEFFNIADPIHLFQFDERFNQNSLTGYAMQRYEAGIIDLAYGGTIANAVIALIPRVVWPDKPVFAGGSAGLKQFAGISYAEGTTANTGHVMEFYVNFGTIGVLCGFTFLGVVIGLHDRMAALALENGDWMSFGVWTLPALSLLFPENSFVMVLGGAVGGAISIRIVNQCIRILLHPGYYYAQLGKVSNDHKAHKD